MPEPEKPKKKRLSWKSFTQGVVAVAGPYFAYGAKAVQHINEGMASGCDRLMGNLFYPLLPRETQLKVGFLNGMEEFEKLLKGYQTAGEIGTGIGVPWAVNGLMNHGLEKMTGNFKAAKETLSAAFNSALAYSVLALTNPSMVEAAEKAYKEGSVESLVSNAQQAGQAFFEGISTGDHRMGNLMALSFGAAALYNGAYKLGWKRIAKPILGSVFSQESNA